MPDETPNPTPAQKSGFLTSELWLSIIGGLVGPGGLIVFLAAHLPPEGLAAAICTAVATAGAIIFKYIQSRQAVKTQ